MQSCAKNAPTCSGNREKCVKMSGHAAVTFAVEDRAKTYQKREKPVHLLFT